jgi:hypothetical protein
VKLFINVNSVACRPKEDLLAIPSGAVSLEMVVLLVSCLEGVFGRISPCGCTGDRILHLFLTTLNYVLLINLVAVVFIQVLLALGVRGVLSQDLRLLVADYVDFRLGFVDLRRSGVELGGEAGLELRVLGVGGAGAVTKLPLPKPTVEHLVPIGRLPLS